MLHYSQLPTAEVFWKKGSGAGRIAERFSFRNTYKGFTQGPMSIVHGMTNTHECMCARMATMCVDLYHTTGSICYKCHTSAS